MAKILPADWGDAFNETTVTSVAGDIAIWEKDQVCFKLADLPADGSDAAFPTKKFTIIEIVLRYVEESGVNKLSDQLAAFATPADGTTARAYPGFQHDDTTGVISGVTGSTTTSRPVFYQIKNVRDGSIDTVHQSDITDVPGWEALNAAKYPDIVV